MAHPTLFIGIGGSGVKTLCHLKRLLTRQLDQEELASTFQFRLFDTDENEWSKVQQEFATEFARDQRFVDRQTEWHSLGDFNPRQRWEQYKQASGDTDAEDVRTWIDHKGADGFPNAIVSVGAEARRQLGRLCLAHHFRNVRTAIETAIRSLNNARIERDVKKNVQIVVVSSSCGGTGSSAFFDLLYLISLIHQDIANSEPFLRPVIFSPQPFIRAAKAKLYPQETIDRYNANACAFFLEFQRAFILHSESKGNGSQDFVFPSLHEAKNYPVNWSPFHGALLIDAQREGVPTFISFDELFLTTAELLFYLTLTGARDSVESQWINCSRDQGKTRPDGTKSFPRYLTAGFRAVEFPAPWLRSYVSERFFLNVVLHRLASRRVGDEGAFRLDADEFVKSVILGEFPESSLSMGGASFRDRIVRSRLSGAGGLLEEVGAIDEFCTPGKGQQLVPDPEAVNAERLAEAIHRLHGQIDTLRATIGQEFMNLFGDPDGTLSKSAYHRIRNALEEKFSSLIEQHGIESWCGEASRPEHGFVNLLLSAIARRREAAAQNLSKSNGRIKQLWAELESLRDAVVQESQGAGSFLARFRPNGKVLGMLKAFAAKRRDIVEESVLNSLHKLEIEVAVFVGDMGPVVRPPEFATVQNYERPSLTADLRDQGLRVRSWLRLEATLSGLRDQERSALVVHEPPLKEIAKENGEPGPLAAQIVSRLEALLAQESGVLAAFSGKPGFGLQWRDICPTSTDRSERLLEEFIDAGFWWVANRGAGDDTLRKLLGQTLPERLQTLPTNRIDELRGALNNDRVAVFNPVADSVRANRPVFRLLVTAAEPGPDSLATQLGYNQADGRQDHLLDRRSSHRALAVKLYSQLYLEEDFPWFAEIRSYYDKVLDYNPHLHRNGRLLCQGGGSEVRWQRGFTVALAWGLLLRGDRWQKEGFRDLLTDKLVHQPEAFLKEGPLAIRNRVPYLLTVRLEKEMINSQNRLECPLPTDRANFETVADEGQWGGTYSAFLKRPIALHNAEFFARWLSGIEFLWPSEQVQIVYPDRARFFQEALVGVYSTVKKRLQELTEIINLSPDDRSTRAVLGWVATELSKLDRQITTALGGGGL